MIKYFYIFICTVKTPFRYSLVILLVIFFLIPSSFSQENIDNIKSDTSKQKLHSPKKATWMSAVLPGLGQAYNKKYWKIPVIWTGLGGLSYSIVFNHNKYVTYRDAYKFRIDNDSTTIDNFPLFSTNYLQTLKNTYRRNMELSVVLTIALYAINIIDATVDAHLYDFDVSDDISFNIKPVMMLPEKQYNNQIYPGFKLTFYSSSKASKKPLNSSPYSLF